MKEQTVEYKSVVLEGNFFSEVLLGESKVNTKKLDALLNEHAKDGWKFKAIERELRRKYGLFSVEAMVLILERDTSNKVDTVIKEINQETTAKAA